MLETGQKALPDPLARTGDFMALSGYRSMNGGVGTFNCPVVPGLIGDDDENTLWALCGSDVPRSGIPANLLIGQVVDRIVAAGGSVGADVPQLTALWVCSTKGTTS